MNDLFAQGGLPSRNTADVWQIDVGRILISDERQDLEASLASVLSAEEKVRADRFRFAKDASRFRICRAILRLGLAHYLGSTPAKITLATRWRDKPCLADKSPLYFNVSHAADMALMAFTTVGEVGIDIEPSQREVEAMEIASRYFTPDETAMVAAAQSPEEQARVFLRFWTRKEAVLKAAGCGISQGLDTIDISQGAGRPVWLRGTPEEIAGEEWQVRDLEVAEGYLAAISAPLGDWSIRQWTLRDSESVDGLRHRRLGL